MREEDTMSACPRQRLPMMASNDNGTLPFSAGCHSPALEHRSCGDRSRRVHLADLHCRWCSGHQPRSACRKSDHGAPTPKALIWLAQNTRRRVAWDRRICLKPYLDGL